MKFPSIRKEILLYSVDPTPWHGHVYFPVNRPYVSISYLIPLNIPLRLGHLLWLWCQTPFRSWEPKWYWPWFTKKQTENRTITTNGVGHSIIMTDTNK